MYIIALSIIALWMITTPGCVETESTLCESGVRCVPGQVCVPGYKTCAQPDVVAACANRAEGETCKLAGTQNAVCVEQQCTAMTCGNGITEEWESCDGAPPADAYCNEFGYDYGHVSCSNSCSAPNYTECRRFGWSEEAVNLSDKALIAAWAYADGVFAVGEDGMIMHRQGGIWTRMESPTDQPLAGIWGNSESNVLAVGTSGTIIHYDGKAWSDISFLPEDERQRLYLTGVWGTDADNIFVIATESSCNPWDLLDGKPLDSTFQCIDTVANIYHYDGVAWKLQFTSPLLKAAIAIWGQRADEVFVVGTQVHLDGGITNVTLQPAMWQYDGNAWSEIDLATNCPSCEPAYILTSIWGSSNTGELFVGGTTKPHDVDDGVILHYRDGQWELRRTKNQIWGIWGHSSDNVYAVGQYRDDGSILHYNGAQWRPVLTKNLNNLYAVTGHGRHRVYAAGVHGTILHPAVEWRQVLKTRDDTGAGPIIRAFWGSGPNHVIAVGTGASIYEDDGLAWTLTQAPAGVIGLTDVWGCSANTVFAVGHDGVILRYDGDTWSRMEGGIGGIDARLEGIWGSSCTDVFAVGTNKTILHYDGNPNGRWRPFDLDSIETDGQDGQLWDVWGRRENDVFVIGKDSTLLHYNGAEWQKSDIEDLKLPQGGTYPMYAIWSPPSKESSAPNIYPDVYSDFYAVGSVGITWHYDGQDWRIQENQAGQDLLAIGGSAPDDIFAAGNYGFIHHYNGVRWEPVRAADKTIWAIWSASPEVTYFADDDGIYQLIRAEPARRTR